MKFTRALLFASSGLALILTGCGKKDSAEKTDVASASANTADASKPAGAPTDASGRQIEITGNDTMKFSVTEIRAKPGETLSVTLTNVGTMPKLSMGHNFVLLKDAKNVGAFVAEASTAATTDYIPQNRKNDIIAHTKLLGPKEKDTVTFQAPQEPGRYVFLCSFPGHYQVGMKGELMVE